VGGLATRFFLLRSTAEPLQSHGRLGSSIFSGAAIRRPGSPMTWRLPTPSS
jgi:hypothetical protein